MWLILQLLGAKFIEHNFFFLTDQSCMTTTAACYNIVYIIGTNSFICKLQREDARVTVHIVFSVRQVEHRQQAPHSSVRSDSYALGPPLWSTPHSVSSLWTCPPPLCNPFNSSAWLTASALRPSGRLGSGPRLPRGRSEPPSDQPCRSPSACEFLSWHRA